MCGYFYKPGLHSGDVARLMRELHSTGVNVYRLDQAVTVREAVHIFGPGESVTDTLPAGTLWIPMAQPQKHWIQAVLGEEPFVPFPYFYDVRRGRTRCCAGWPATASSPSNMPSGVADDARQRPAAADGAARPQPGVRVQRRLDAGHSAWRST